MINSSFYGDTTRWFFGVVVNNIDNSGTNTQRVQVRIWGVHDNMDEIPNGQLPWAYVVLPSTEGGINGLGTNSQLEIGSQVFGFFLDGPQSQVPMVIGSIPRVMFPETLTQRNNLTGGEGVSGGISSRYFDFASGGSYPEVELSGSVNAEKAFNFFVEKGWSPEQSAGIVGNLQAESYPDLRVDLINRNDSPNSEISVLSQGDGKDSHGIAQWNDVRYRNLVTFAASRGKGWDNLETQLNFILWEFNNTETSARDRLRDTNTVTEAAISFMKFYERPSNTDGVYPSQPNRVNFANDIYRRYN